MNLLIIESDSRLRGAVAAYFKEKNLDIDTLDDYDQILEEFEHMNLHEFDAFMFGIADNDTRGLDLIDYMRLIEIDAPVLCLAHTHSLNLLSRSFGRGAEDYLRVPFEMKELELRLMKAVRKKVAKDEIELPSDYTYVYSESAIALHHSYIDLTLKQRRLLYLLVTNRNQLVSYDLIRQYVYDGGKCTHNALASHMRDLRKKLPGLPIKAIREQGYLLKS